MAEHVCVKFKQSLQLNCGHYTQNEHPRELGLCMFGFLDVFSLIFHFENVYKKQGGWSSENEKLKLSFCYYVVISTNISNLHNVALMLFPLSK